MKRDKTRAIQCSFFVVPAKSVPVIGLNTCEKLQLIKRCFLINGMDPQLSDKYESLFDDIGCLQGKYKIKIDPNVIPVIHSPSRIPFALKPKLKAELQRMLGMGVISKVETPTSWVNSMVCVEKRNGDIRVCIDPRDLNRAIVRDHVQLPTAKEIMSKIAGAKIFSTLDASAGYWQIHVDDESSELLVFNTPFGRFKVDRLPFGISCASEAFSQRISQIIEGLDGVAHIQDDIIIWGRSKAEHDKNLEQVLARIEKSGLKLNKTKCKFGLNEVKYVVHIFSSEGVRADPSKIEAIVDMPMPENASGVHHFLGMVTYLGKFLPNLSDKTACLRKLIAKDAV